MTIGRLAAANSTRIGVAGAVIVFVGIALLFAFEQPPFVAPDETAHVGYAHEIAGFDLPEVTKSPDVPDSAVQWQAERESGRDDRYRAVWVANHPPLHYIITAPLIWLSNALDRPDGGLMFMRLANIAFAAIGVVLTYLLGRDLSGGVRRIGVAARGDRRARAAGAHAVLGGDERRHRVRRGDRRRLGRRPLHRNRRGRYGRGDLVLLGAAAAACAGARSATLVVAVVVVIWVAVARLLTAPGSAGARARGGGVRCGRRPAPGGVAVRLVLHPQRPAVRRLRRLGVPPRPLSADPGGFSCSRSSRGGTCGSTSTTC